MAFFLYHNSADVNPEKARQVFGRVGFANTEEFRLGANVLIVDFIHSL